MKQAIQDALTERGYDTLTPVQTAVSDPELTGQDLLVSAQTGSGKTLGFGLAITPTLLGEAEAFEAAGAPLALVIAPTRELALQVKRELSWLFAKAGAELASTVGGMDMRDERRALSRGAHIVVATPGRLRDHIMRGSIDLSQLRAVVLDEADEMLDLGFREDLEFILGESPEDRQTLMFSATVPKSIAALAQSYQRDAKRVVAKSENAQHADITYLAMNVAERDTENAVINALLFHKAPNAIVFGNTRAMVNRLTTRLSNRGFKVVALSGELSQSERTHALQAMRDGRANVCVATDVAARGIDLPNLDLVIHAELPSNHETLLHRSGRTGRAGRKGVSALIVTRKSVKKAERILKSAKVRAEWTTAPSADDVNAREEERMLTDETWSHEVEPSEVETVTKLQENFSAEQLATAYLRLYRSVRSTPEELGDANAKPAPREDFGPTVWFSISGGRNAGAEPRRLLPMLCKATGLTRDDIGAIRVRDSESYVQIKVSKADALADGQKLEAGAVATKLAKAPDLDQGRPPKRDFGDKPKRDYSDKPKRDYGDKPKRDHSDKPKRDFGDKPKRDYSDKPKRDYADKPKKDFDDKPKRDWSDTSTPRAKAGAKPYRKSTPPVDYNDAPNPKFKKPKPAGAGFKGKPKREIPEGVTERKPRHVKGGKPPVGKPSSKKNRARQAEAKSFKGKGKPSRD